MREIHSLLKRQFKRHPAVLEYVSSPECQRFIDDVNEAYCQSDDDRKMLERSLDLSSQELVQANSEMRAILQALPDLYFLLDEKGKILDCKGGQTTDFLLPPQQLLGKKIQDIPFQHIGKIFQEGIDSVRTSNQIEDIEYSISAKEKVYFYEARLVPLRENKIIAVVRNITARKHAEHGLEHSLSLLRATLESTADGILVVDGQGKIMSYNKKFLEMWRIPESVIEPLNDENALRYVLDQLVNPDEFLKKVNELYAQPDTESYDVLKFKDGRIFERYSQSQSIGGKSAGRVWSFRDVSEQRRLEEQLRHSQKMESIGTLAGGIAHDFNNILGIITGYASVLEKQVNSPAELARSIEAIIKTSERGATVVRQMLTFARKTTVEFESVNINSVIKELEKMLEHTFPRTICFSLQLDQRIPPIVADHNQIHQALLNLCVNAKDAMNDNGALTIQTGIVEGIELSERFSSAETQQYVCVNIMDTGQGIDEVTRNRIFEPFFTTKGPGKGTGLGLAVVYGIVNHHRGFIDVTSEIGQGATFSLYFPIASQIEDSYSDIHDDTVEVPRGTETILVVEDEEMLLDLLRNILEAKGYAVLAARDGLEGIETYTRHQHQVALVLTDMGLPRLNGREVYKKMKAINPEIRVIIASGYLDPSLRADLLNDGVKDFIQKPYLLNDVLKRVHSVLHGPLN